MSSSALENSVKKSLLNLNREQSLKDLFWSKLSYDRVNQELSRRNWSDCVASELSSDPLLLAAAGQNNDFRVIYSRFKGDRLLKQKEREIVNKLLPNNPYSLFIFSNEARSQWHFLNVKYDDSPQKRKLFRRIKVEAGDNQLRTATEQLSLLDLESFNSDSPLEIQKQHDEAFDVEVVTQKFFSEYSNVFGRVEKLIQGIDISEKKRLYTQKLFNRLMFISFIQKKGWLTYNGDKDYLSALWKAYCKEQNKRSNFYRDRLSHLFFSGLNNSSGINIIDINNGGFLKNLIGNVPFLNGGLFEQGENEKDSNIIVPDECIDLILHDLFQKFAFTVTESTPLDVEVAVDPEMLGKVFEELVTGRHESGSYYTPKPIVSFMCRESLKGYLKTQVAEETTEAIAKLVDEQNPDKLSNSEAVLEAIEKVRTCDLACGSGAYLLGMLHELLDLRQRLSNAEEVDSNTVYQHKLEIIQNNLYGVDIDVFAVNIARLRLWLSLAVDYEGDKPQPLPNLKYKIDVGDSLISPNPTEIKLTDVLIEKYRQVKAEYIKTHNGDRKKVLEKEVTKLKKEISLITYGNDKVDRFDWSLDFAEVFADGGFDVVVANPPYGAKVGDNVRDLYFDRRIDGAQSKDTYGLFLARCLQLLKTNGQLSYIVSDTWRTIKSHKPLRKRLLETTTIAHIIDLPSWVFNATVNTCIFTASKTKPSDEHNLIAADLRSIESSDWQSLTKNLDAIANSSVDLQPLNYARYTYPQSLIGTYENLSFFIASPTLYKLFGNNKLSRVKSIAEVKQGLATGNNEYYLRKREGIRGGYQILDESKLLTEQDIAQLTDEEKSNGVDPHKYQGRYFLPYDKGGESNAGEGWLPNYYVPTQYFIDWSKEAVNRLKTATRADIKEYKGQVNKIKPADCTSKAAVIRNPQYYFHQGLTFSPTGVYSPTFRLGCNAIFGNKGSTIFFQDMESKVMLGILTSTFVRYLLKCFASHTVETGEEVITQLALPVLDDCSKQKLKSLVERIISKQKDDPFYPYHLHEQREIDKLVYKLYGLSDEDIREVEIWYCRRYQKLAEAQGILTEVREKYAEYLALCEQNLDRQTIDLPSSQNLKAGDRVAALYGL